MIEARIEARSALCTLDKYEHKTDFHGCRTIECKRVEPLVGQWSVTRLGGRGSIPERAWNSRRYFIISCPPLNFKGLALPIGHRIGLHAGDPCL